MVSATSFAQQTESLTQQLGRDMFARMRALSAGPLQYEWWEERMMEQFMRFEWLKVQAFRFIDALPTLHDDVAVAQHMREYLVHPGWSAAVARGGRRAAPRDPLAELEPQRFDRALYGFVSRLMNFRDPRGPHARALVNLARWSTRLMASGFIAGSDVLAAERAIRHMRDSGLAFTIDVLGEAAVSGIEAEQYQQTYLHLIEELPKRAALWPDVPLADRADGAPLPRVNVSVKITSLYPGFDGLAAEASIERGKALLRPLLRKAMAGGVHLHIDMEHYAIKDLTLDLCEQLFLEDEFRDYPHFGIVLQAYLKDGDADARRAVDYAKRRGTPYWVRLVKGAYWDSETVWSQQRGWPCPVWQQKWQSDACYERMSRILLENHKYIGSAFASHNIRSLCHARALKHLLHVPSAAFEWQMLYGMGNPMKRAAVQLGERCRVYTPFGELMPGMAYFIRRLLENTANESFLRRTADEADEPVLLEDPGALGRRTPPPAPPVYRRYEFEEPVMEPFENAPSTDFSQAANRQAMLAALADTRAALGGAVPLLIGGQPADGDEQYASTNPSRPDEVVGRIAQASAAQVDRSVAAARDAFGDWRREPVETRAQVLRRAAELLAERRFELAALEILECAKPWRDADADVVEAIDFCNYHASELLRLSDYARRRDVPGELNEYYYRPRGVVAAMSHWNFPLAIAAAQISAALAMGDTVVFKPANQAATAGARLAEIFVQAGLPAAALNFLPGPDDVICDALAAHPHVPVVAYTGPRDIGERLHRVAATSAVCPPGYKRFIAELGGKNAIIIDSDADLDEAIKGLLESAFGYAGQKCSACARVIVLSGAYDRLMERFVEAARSRGVGPADEPTTMIPPVIDKAAMERISDFIELGKQEGTCVLESDVSEQRDAAGAAYFVGPTIFTDIPPSSRVAREEIFGPVLTASRVDTIADAIRLFNDCDFALTGGIYSRSPANIERARHECECGNFYINRPITGAKVDLQPFGGYRASGTNSKVGGPDYLLQFCEPRTVTENTLRRGFAPSEEMQEAYA